MRSGARRYRIGIQQCGDMRCEGGLAPDFSRSPSRVPFVLVENGYGGLQINPV